MSDLLERLNDYIIHLPIKLQNHLNRTAKLGRELAQFHGVNEEKVLISCVAHDIAKKLHVNEILKISKQNNLKISFEEENSPILMHGPLASYWLENQFLCKDREILNSVFFHTTGRPNMSEVEKIVFLADKVEPHKVAKNPELVEILNTCFSDIDLAILKYLDMKIMQLLNQDQIIHPLAIEARNYYMK
jgi:predicted HD superfamily hydrolase involved in NAD metabolism